MVQESVQERIARKELAAQLNKDIKPCRVEQIQT